MAARGGGAKSGGALPNLRSFGPKTAIFRPKRPQNPGETPKRRDTVSTLHVRLDFTVSKTSLVPFNSTICPRNGPKRRQKAPKSAQCAPTPRNQARPVSWATWLKIRFRGHLVHPQLPTFCGFQASESPNDTPKPPYQWSLGGAGGQPGPRTVGANGGSTRVPGAKKIIFSKVVPRPLGMLKQAFLGRFQPVVAHFEPRKIPKCFKIGPFWDQKWVKNGSKTRFSKSDPRPFGMLKQVVLARFEPVVARFAPCIIPKFLEIGLFWDQKWVKNGSKTRFSKSDPSDFRLPAGQFLVNFSKISLSWNVRPAPMDLARKTASF